MVWGKQHTVNGSGSFFRAQTRFTDRASTEGLPNIAVTPLVLRNYIHYMTKSKAHEMVRLVARDYFLFSGFGVTDCTHVFGDQPVLEIIVGTFFCSAKMVQSSPC